MPVPLASADLFPKIPKALRPSVEAALQLDWSPGLQSEMAQVTTTPQPTSGPPEPSRLRLIESWIGTLWYSWMQIHNIYIYIYSILLYKSLCWWAQETTHKLLEVLLLHLTAVHPVNQIYLCRWAARLLCPPYPKLMLCDSSPTHQLAAPSKILSSSATLWQFNCTTIAIYKASYGVSPLVAKRMMSHTNLISVDHSVSLRVCLERSPGLVPNPVWRFHKYGIHLQKFHPPIPCVTLSYVRAWCHSSRWTNKA